MTWPVCGERIVVFDLDLCCVLPRNHQLDGEREHCDESGTRWSWAITVDGEVVEVNH